MFEFYKTSKKQYSKFYTQVHTNLSSQITTKRVNAWQSLLSLKKIKYIEYMCKDLMDYYGYRPFHSSVYDIKRLVLFSRITILFKFPLKLLHYLVFRRDYLFCVLRRKYKLRLLKNFNDIKDLFFL